MIKLSPLALIFSPLVFVAACGGSTASGNDAPAPDAAPPADAGVADTSPAPDASDAADAAPDVDNGEASTVYPAAFPMPPQVVKGGGAVLTTPRVVPIFFSDYDATLQQQVADFVTSLAADTSYVSTTMSEYGVTSLTAGTPIVLTEAAPTGTSTAPYDDSSIRTWLENKLSGTDPQFGAADPNTIYTIFFPASTIISLGQGDLSCQEFGGYHDNIDLPMTGGDGGDGDGGVTPISYAVIPSCSNFHNLNGIDMITGAASHEIVEASTDPYPSENVTGYSDVDQDHLVWDFVLGGGEIGDMCAQYADAFFKPSGLDYYVQRIWSNEQALAGHNPCVPADGPVYFNSAAVLNDSLTLSFGQMSFMTKGVRVPMGETATVEIDLFSDGPTSGPWTVTATEPSMGGGGGSSTPSLDLSLDRTSGVNGEKLHLTIKTVSSSSFGVSVFQLTSTLGSQTAYWAGMVQTK